MATRIRTNSSGAVDVTPATWTFATQLNPVTVPGTLTLNTGSAMTSKTETISTTNPHLDAFGRTIIGPLEAQTISGTVRGQMRGAESIAGANSMPALAVKLVRSDGVDRGVLLAPVGSDSAVVGNEFVLSLTNSIFKNLAESATLTLTSQAAQRGDYLVIEWGIRSQQATAGRTATLSYGNSSATDLTLGDTTVTAANNPWWEFSQDLVFFTADDPTLLNYAQPFTAADTLLIPESLHGIAHAAVAVQVLDASTPAAVIEPGRVTVHATTHQVSVTFLQPQSGLVLLHGATANAAGSRNKRFPFTTSPLWTIDAATHGFTTGRLFVVVYDDSSPPRRLRPGLITVHQSTFEVQCTFLQAQAGAVVLCAAAASGTIPNYSASFGATGSLSVPGATHDRGTNNLLVEVYDTSTPAVRLQPGRLTVSPTAPYDVTVAFLQNQAGLIVIGGSLQATAITLAASIQGGSATPASIPTQLRSLTASIHGTSLTPVTTSTALRSLVGRTDGQAPTPAVPSLTTHRQLVTALRSTSLTVDTSFTLTALIALTAALRGTSMTPAATPTTARVVAAALAGQSLTLAVPISTGVGLVAALRGQSLTPAPPVLLARALVSQSRGSSTTSALTAGITSPNYAHAFGPATTVTIAGSAHGIGHAALLVQVLDNSTPAVVLEPASVTVDASTFTVNVTFLHNQSGLVLLNGATPSTQGVFGNASKLFSAASDTWIITEAEHHFATGHLVVAAYDATTPYRRLRPGRITIDQTTHEVRCTFLQPQAGLVIISGYAATGPEDNYSQVFTNQPSVTIAEGAHARGTMNLLVEVWDTGTPRRRLVPGSTTLDAATHALTVSFLQPQSGTVVLNGSQQASLLILTARGTAHSTTPAPLVTTVRQLTAAVAGPSVIPAIVSVDPSLANYAHPFSSGTPDHEVVLTAAQHQAASPALLVQVLDTTVSPAQVVEPGSVTIDAALTVRVHLLGLPTGLILLNGASPPLQPLGNYSQAFTGVASVALDQSQHGFATGHLVVAVYDTAVEPPRLLQPGGSLTILQTAPYTVTATFGDLQSGRIVVSGAAMTSATPHYSTTFTTTEVSVPGAVHGRGTANLLIAVYDNSTPRALLYPDVITVDASTFEVRARFLDTQSGLLVIGGSSRVTVRALQSQLGGVSRTTTLALTTARPLVTSVGGQSATPASSAVQVRQFVSTLQATSQTSAIVQDTLRVVLARLAGQSSTAPTTSSLARSVGARLAAQSATSPVLVTSQRLLVTRLHGLSTVLEVAAQSARLLLAQHRGQSWTPALASSMAAVRSFLASLPGMSQTTTPAARMTRSLLAQGTGVSLTPASAATQARRLAGQPRGASGTADLAPTTARRLPAAIRGPTVTRDTSHVVTALLEFTARLAGTSLTAAAASASVRWVQARVDGTSQTPVSQVAQVRSVLSQARASSVTLLASTTMATLRSLLTQIWGSGTTPPQIDGHLARLVLGRLQATSATPAVAGSVLRPLGASLRATSLTSASGRLLVRGVTAQATAHTRTPDVPSLLARRVTSQVRSHSFTTDIATAVSDLVSLVVRLQASSHTPSLAQALTRNLTAQVQSLSRTPALTVQQQRRLLGHLEAASTTGAVETLLQRLLAAALGGQSQTASLVLTGQRLLQSAIGGQSATLGPAAVQRRALVSRSTGWSTTAEAGLTMRRPLLAALRGTSTHPEALLALTVRLTAVLAGQSASLSAAVLFVRQLQATAQAQASTRAALTTALRLLQAEMVGASTSVAIEGIPFSGMFVLTAALGGRSLTSAPTEVDVPAQRTVRVLPRSRVLVVAGVDHER